MNPIVRIACVFGILTVLTSNGVNYTNPQYWLVCLLIVIIMVMSYLSGHNGE